MKVIIACPRSGTGYASKLFNLGHEVLNKNGISSWLIVAPNAKTSPWGPAREWINLSKATIIHQVRNPFDVIASLATNKPAITDESWEFIMNNSKVQSPVLLERAMETWYYWNLLCEDMTDQVQRLEDLPKKHLPRNERKGDRNLYSIEDIKNTNMRLYDNIVELSAKYGYV